MHDFANTKYETFSKIWTQFDESAFAIGVVMAFWLFYFHCVTSFGISTHEFTSAYLVGFAISFSCYVVSCAGYLPLEVSAVVALFISFSQSRKQQTDFILWLRSKTKKENLKPKEMLYDCLTLSLLIMFVVAQEVDSMSQEADYVIDAFLLLCLAYMWATQPSHLRSKDIWASAAIVFCIKASYFVDTQSSLNFNTDHVLASYRQWIREEPLITIAVPLLAMLLLENKINRHYNFGMFNKVMTHSLTAALGYYYYLRIALRPPSQLVPTKHSIALEKEHTEQMAMVGYCIYIAVAVCCMVSFFYFKIIKKKSWENVSVRNGLLIAKAAMLVTGTPGPFVYFCLCLQFYSFALIVNHRRDSKPGATFPIQIFFIYFTMQQYFFRTNHRERFSSLQVGKVCPGGDFCGEIFSWVLVLFEAFAPFIVCLSLMPFIVKARISYAYAHTKKKDSEPVAKPVATKSAKVSTEVASKVAYKLVSEQTEFVGDMAQGMQYMQLMTILLIGCSSIFVWWTKEEVIFPERSAPKFAFDIVKTAVIIPFVLFWM